ncbi:MAG: alpha-L-arabinofuranosidase C-terminal domain-containing protein [Pseudomonadota bacterium]
MKRLIAVAALCGLAWSGVAHAQIRASATIDLARPGPRIAPEIYGQFAEQLGKGITEGIWVGEDSPIPNVRGYRLDVLKAVQELRVPVLRWPGGCYADTYHWRDGIGPRNQRPITLNRWWGNNEENNAFGTHEYFDFAELIGARTFLSVNVGSGTAGEAKDWVEYVTSASRSRLAQERRANGRDKPWTIDYAGIGNEVWGCGGNLTAEQYAPYLRVFATFVRQDQGPKTVAVGPAADDYSWTEEIMKSRDKFDVLSLHYYTLPTGDWAKKGPAVGFGKADWLKTFAQTRRLDEFLAKHSAIMDRTDPARKVAIAVDEWGTWYDTPPGAPALWQENTLRDALVAATNFHIFHRHAERVRMANIAQMVNVLQAMILTDGPRMVKTPTYYAFQMYVPFQGATSLPVQVQAPELASGAARLPAVDVTAAKGPDGATYVGLVNIAADEAATVQLTGGAGAAAGRISGQVLTAPAMDSRNRFGAAEEVHPRSFAGFSRQSGGLRVAMPAKSIVVLRIDPPK